MKPLKKIAFVVEDFAVQTPAQQLLDRFLLGYPRDGGFHKPECGQVSIYTPASGQNTALEQREKEFKLLRPQTLAEALENADGIVVVGNNRGAPDSDELLRRSLEQVPAGSACFAHGVLSHTLQGAKDMAELARTRKVSLLAGTPTAVTWRLPETDLPPRTRLAQALIVVQGESPLAELHGLEGLLPVIERRRGGESGVRSVRQIEGEEVWKAGTDGLWSWPLLAAAISRSNTPQGDPQKDGRTQDLAGLGLIQKLARHPRAAVIEHRDGLRSAILVLDGVVADFNFAVEARDGAIISAQLYRPPPPFEHHYSRLAGVIENFFRRDGTGWWAVDRNVLIAGLLESFHKSASRSGQRLKTPELRVSYSS